MKLNRRSFLGGLLALPAVAKLLGKPKPAPAQLQSRSAPIAIPQARAIPVDSQWVIYGVAGEDLIAGQAVYLRTDARWAPCDATHKPIGISLGDFNDRKQVRVILWP